MAITSNATLFLNAFERIISYKGVQKQINDDFWQTEIIPILNPFWDIPKDRLEIFVYRSDETFLIQRSKYKYDFKTGTSKWVSYEFDPGTAGDDSIKLLYEQLKQKFIEYNDISEANYKAALERRFAQTNILTLDKIKLVRKFLLDDSDYVFADDYTGYSEEIKLLWKQYRQYLRDFLKLQEPQTPYDVVFPITPSEYLSRKNIVIPSEVMESVGDQGVNADYLSSPYHFWKLSSNALASFSQRMSVYIALKALTVDSAGIPGRILVNKFYTEMAYDSTAQNAVIVNKGEDYLDALIAKIENGEI